MYLTIDAIDLISWIIILVLFFFMAVIFDLHKETTTVLNYKGHNSLSAFSLQTNT